MRTIKSYSNVLILTVFVLFAAANMAQGTMIDFETLPGGTAVTGGTDITDQYASWGVTFSSNPSSYATQVTNIIDTMLTSSGINFLAPGGPAPYHGGTLILEFSVAVVEVGAYFIDDNMPVDVLAYDAGMNIIDTLSSDGNPTGFEAWTITYPNGIARVLMVGKNLDGDLLDGWGIDDLSYTFIPEPATLLLLALGLPVVMKRKRR